MNAPHESPFPQLAARVADGDERAFEQVFETYCDRLYRYLDAYVGSREQAEALVRDLFSALWRDRAELARVADLQPHLYAAARALALEHLHGRHSAAVPHEVAAEVRRAVDLMPPRQREVLIRKWQDEASREEIAAAMQISVLTVGKHLTRAYDHLGRVLPRLL